MPWRYEGVLHEYPVCDDAYVEKRLDGTYYIDSRRLGARNLDPRTYELDRDLLLAEIDRDPDDARSMFYLAQSCFDLGDFGAARRWYARRAEMSVWDEETHCAMFRLAESKELVDEPWPDVQDAYLRAWEFRPTRAELLQAIANHYRREARYQLGHLFATQATDIAVPEQGERAHPGSPRRWLSSRPRSPAAGGTRAVVPNLIVILSDNIPAALDLSGNSPGQGFRRGFIPA